MKHANKALWSLAIVALLASAYAGAYLAMLQGPRSGLISGKRLGWGEHSTDVDVWPSYRFEHPWVHQFFRPANRIDAMLRPRMWVPFYDKRPRGETGPMYMGEY